MAWDMQQVSIAETNPVRTDCTSVTPANHGRGEVCFRSDGLSWRRRCPAVA